MSEKENFKVK